MATAAQLLTVDEFLALPEVQESTEKLELVEGEIVHLGNARIGHELTKANLNRFLVKHTFDQPEWLVMPESIWLVNNRNGYIPDLSLVRTERLDTVDRDARPQFGPELAIEIVSRESAFHLHTKLRAYFAAGTLVVWAVYRELKSVWVYTPSGAKEYVVGDVLTFDTCPGLAIPVKAIFPAEPNKS